MRSSILAGLLAAGSAHAFSDSSPFLLFSTAEFSSAQQPSQLQTSSRVLSAAKDILGRCPTTNYLLVSQANIHASDLDGPEGCGVHRIRSAVTGDGVHGRYIVAEVVNPVTGNMSFEGFSEHIKKSCLEMDNQEANIRQLSLTPLPASQDCKSRAEAMDDNDYVLGNILQEELPAGDYTVLFFSTPHECKPYEVEFENPSQIQLTKRIAEPVRTLQRKAAADANWSKDAALFDKYQFFTPGIFMGLTALFVLLSILYVGLSALASLEVSYGAFDKDVSPTAQKKQA